MNIIECFKKSKELDSQGKKWEVKDTDGDWYHLVNLSSLSLWENSSGTKALIMPDNILSDGCEIREQKFQRLQIMNLVVNILEAVNYIEKGYTCLCYETQEYYRKINGIIEKSKDEDFNIIEFSSKSILFNEKEGKSEWKVLGKNE